MGKIMNTNGKKSADNELAHGVTPAEYSNNIMELVLMERSDPDSCSCREQSAEDMEIMNYKKYQGSETVLLVDDQIALVKLLESVLLECGYRVITAHDGQHAIDIFKENSDSIDIILMDIIMPRKDGVKAYYEISSIKPDIKILFMSGFPADCLGDLSQQIEMIVKPITPTEILKKIREKLDGARHAGTF